MRRWRVQMSGIILRRKRSLQQSYTIVCELPDLYRVGTKLAGDVPRPVFVHLRTLSCLHPLRFPLSVVFVSKELAASESVAPYICGAAVAEAPVFPGETWSGTLMVDESVCPDAVYSVVTMLSE